MFKPKVMATLPHRSAPMIVWRTSSLKTSAPTPVTSTKAASTVNPRRFFGTTGDWKAGRCAVLSKIRALVENLGRPCCSTRTHCRQIQELVAAGRAKADKMVLGTIIDAIAYSAFATLFGARARKVVDGIRDHSSICASLARSRQWESFWGTPHP
jgi:hypothetical protein